MRKLFSWELRRRAGRVVVLAMFLNLNLGCISPLTDKLGDLSQTRVTRAPREGSTDMSASSCCSGGDSAELSLIRGCVCQINSNMTTLLSCCEELDVSGIDELLTCCEDLTGIIRESFSGTWTAIEACCNGGGITECCRETWTILGDQSEVVVGGIDTLDEINTSTLSIIAWLKTMYAQSRGLIT